MNGAKPSLSVAQATRVRTIHQRRAELRAQIAGLKAELATLPTMPELAIEHDVCLTTILNTAKSRHTKHHVIEARQASNTQEQSQC